MIRNDRVRSRGRARRIVPGVRPPRGVELAYAKALRGYIAHARELVKTFLLPKLDEIFPVAIAHHDEVSAAYHGLYGHTPVAEACITQHLRNDAPTTHHGIKISSVMGNVRLLFEARTRGEPEAIAKHFGTLTARNNEKRSEKLVKTVIGVNRVADTFIAPMIDNFVTLNVGLIESIPETAFSQIETMVRQSALTGTRPEGLADDILERFDVSESKAKMIARDQTAKLNSAITKATHESIGVDNYKWRGTLDERERPSHRQKEGRTYAWDDPPADTGHPGEDYQCRCYPEAILPGEEDVEDDS